MQLHSAPIHLDVHDTIQNESFFCCILQNPPQSKGKKSSDLIFIVLQGHQISCRGPASDLGHLKGPQMDPTEKEMGLVATPEEKFID